MNCILLPADTPFYNQQQESIDCSGLPIKDVQAVITDTDQIAHIRHILNSKVGETLKIGQLQGYLGTAIISKLDESAVHLTNICLNKNPPEKMDLTIILALPRPKVLRRLIMDMTAIGVKRIVLVNSARSQKSYWQSPLLKRIDEFVIEGLQQGVDTVAPEILLRQRFKPFVEDELSAWIKNDESTVVAHPLAGESFTDFIKTFGKPKIVCIGAEGGWVDYEVALLQAQGAMTATFGQRLNCPCCIDEHNQRD